MDRTLRLLLLLGAFGVLGAQEPTLRQRLDGWKETLTSPVPGLKLSAFADMGAGYDESGARNCKLGAFEADLEGRLGEWFEYGGAWVKNGADAKWTVGFLDYHPFGGQVAPRGRLWVEQGFHVQVGRFDGAVGNDYPFFASKDSLSISRPLTTQSVMDGGLNDAGVRLLGNNGTANANLYLLRGSFGGRLVGGRVGITPLENPFSLKGAREAKRLEVGFSAFRDRDEAGDVRDRLWAVDLEARSSLLALRAEGFSRWTCTEVGAFTRRAWQVTGEGTLDPDTAVFARLDRAWRRPATEDAGVAGQDFRLSAGVRRQVGGTLQLKLEVQRAFQASAEADPRLRQAGWGLWGSVVGVF